MKTILASSLLIAFALARVPAVRADWIPINPKGYICYRATGPINIDGKLHENSWQDAPWTDDFVDIQGDLKPLPRFRTRAKELCDD